MRLIQLLQQIPADQQFRTLHFRYLSSIISFDQPPVGQTLIQPGRGPLPAVELQGFHGILNSCTNLLLERMESGESFDAAVDYARSIGIAETDPSADVDGWDAAIKVAALATVLMGIPLKPQQVQREGIRAITPQMLAEARAAGERWKLVCTAKRRGGQILEARVRPERVGPDSPLYSIGGTSSYVQFETDVLPGLGIFGIGGGVMVLVSIILASQTFIFPRTTYQLEKLSSSLFTMVAACGGIVTALWIMRRYLAESWLVSRIMLPSPAEELDLDHAEALVDWNYLEGKRGVTTTPLTPSGKARFGDDVVNVLSHGILVPAGTPVRVLQVLGNRVLVEPLDGG